MKNFISKLMNLGNEHFTKETDIKNNIIANQIILIFISGIFFFILYLICAMFYMIHLKQDIIVPAYHFVPPTFSMVAVLVLSFFLKYKTGKNTLIISIAYILGIAYLTYMDYIVGPTVLAYMVLFTLIPLPFFIFDRSHVKAIIGLEIVLWIMIFFTYFYNTGNIPPVKLPKELETATNYMIMFLTAGFLTGNTFYLWNETLITEEKVIQEKHNTQAALDSLNVLKVQQDGDYFLTSLLTDPLNFMNLNSETVKAEIFLKSKKQFVFRNKHKELGGDINIIDEIHLSGRKYIIFMNADAMGKSLQGAGGALVLGAAFKSLILRAKKHEDEEDQFPESWLKTMFEELGQIFETFNGSMLVSAVIGLIEEDTGFLYYVNAEHPFLVLLRDGKAKFIETELQNRKLGITGFDDGVCIKLFQLRNNDILIAGSDGRDDIMMPDAGGIKKMNHDETLFLSAVEKGEGNLNRIFQVLDDSGDLSDDLSMIRISFHGMNRMEEDSSEEYKKIIYTAMQEKNNRLYHEAVNLFTHAMNTFSENVFILKQITSLYLRLGDFRNMLEYSQRISKLAPEETRYLFYTSFAYYKLGDIAKAIYYSERVYLREPDNLKNIIHLIKLCKLSGSRKLFDQYLNAGLKLDPDNHTLQAYRNLQ